MDCSDYEQPVQDCHHNQSGLNFSKMYSCLIKTFDEYIDKYFFINIWFMTMTFSRGDWKRCHAILILKSLGISKLQLKLTHTEDCICLIDHWVLLITSKSLSSTKESATNMFRLICCNLYRCLFLIDHKVVFFKLRVIASHHQKNPRLICCD